MRISLESKKRFGIKVQDRDVHALFDMGRRRYLTSAYLRQKHFNGSRLFYRRAQLWLRKGWVFRFPQDADGVIRPYVWTLSMNGRRLVAQTLGMDLDDLYAHQGPSRRLVPHETALAAVEIAFDEAVEQLADVSLVVWNRSPKLESNKGEVVPDAEIQIQMPRGLFHGYIELDMGSARPVVILDKARRYAAVYQTGHVPAFRVLLVVQYEARMELLLETLKPLPEHVLFRVGVQHQMVGRNLLTAPIWRQTGKEKGVALMPAP